MSSSAIEGLKPELVWKHFAALSQIPRCSKHEAAAAQFVLKTAQDLGLEAQQDAVGNVVVRKPPTAGYERRPAVCLQSHVDMVCEKNAETVHDFSKDPIELVRDGDVVRANGTTLGADNGIGVATALAVLEDRSLEHGPIEALFTIDEETGLTGAQHLGPGFVTSRILLNLDSEEEGQIYIGCAGGLDTLAAWKLVTEEARENMVPFELKVAGLKGGHSGVEIDKGRGNALKIAARVLTSLAAGASARLARIDGGNKRNAIPREAFALVFLPPSRAGRARKLVKTWNATVRAELARVEPDLTVTLTEASAASRQIMKRALQKKVLQGIVALPHGVTKMSAEISWLVETSTNVASIATSATEVTLATSQRSSVASEIDEIGESVRAVLELAGATVTQDSGYPGWAPNTDSPILKLAVKTYESLFHKAPEVKAVHAGLECGIIGEKYSGMDMISFGPTMVDVHSPEERIFVDTVPQFWDFLAALLRAVE
jgi:dipeptidase D